MDFLKPSREDLPVNSRVYIANVDGINILEKNKKNNAWCTVKNYSYAELSNKDIKMENDGPVYAEFRVKKLINENIKTVFEYVANVKTHPEYADFVDSLSIISDNKSGLGVVFTQTHPNSSEEYTSEITVFNPPKQVQWIVERDPANLTINYWFNNKNGSTEIIHTGITRIYPDQQTTLFSDISELKEHYNNNVRELNSLQKILE